MTQQHSAVTNKKANELQAKGAKLLELHPLGDNLDQAITLLKQAHELGNKSATVTLGTAYYQKALTCKAGDEIIQGLEVSCSYGNTQAMYTLAKIYLNGTQGAEVNTTLAAKLLEQAASNNHTRSQVLMANILMANILMDSPKAPEANIKKGLELLALAAAKDNRIALLALGVFALNGQYGLVDYEQAHLHLDRCSLLGGTEAMYQLARLYGNKNNPAHNTEQHIKWLAKAASGYHVKATQEIKRYDRLNDLKHSAEQGDSYAQFDLGMSHLYGIGGANQDTEQAKLLLFQAATQGSSCAQYELGRLYQESDDEEERMEASSVLYEAAEQGHIEAMYLLSQVLIYNEEEKAAFTMLKAAADNGHLSAQLEVADVYLHGRYKVRENASQASHYFQLARAQRSE